MIVNKTSPKFDTKKHSMYDIPDYNFRDVIEMSFWMLSFLEKFEKEFEESQKRIAQGFITHNFQSCKK